MESDPVNFVGIIRRDSRSAHSQYADRPRASRRPENRGTSADTVGTHPSDGPANSNAYLIVIVVVVVVVVVAVVAVVVVTVIIMINCKINSKRNSNITN